MSTQLALAVALRAWALDRLELVEPLPRAGPARGADNTGRRQRDWPSVTELHTAYRASVGPEHLGLIRFSRLLVHMLSAAHRRKIEPVIRFGAKRVPVRIKGAQSP